jgi:hypothetical protein
MSTRPVSLPAPIGGWNARDSLAEMPETDAPIMTNWFPTPTYVQLRQGFGKFATGLPGQVNSVMAYNAGTTSKLFAASGNNIYNITSGGSVGAAVVSGLTNDNLLHTNMATAGGNFLLFVNGQDKLRGYNGSTWWTDGDGTHDITGINTATVSNIYVAKQRVWLIEKNSLRVWYLPVSSIAGAAVSIDFGSLCRKGGYLVAMAEWTTSGGFGMTSLTCFITSEGEILIYQGYDPSSATAWTLQGCYHLGSPMGPKCLCKAGNDLLLISKEGLTPLSQGTFFADTSATKGTLTDKIQWAISQATTNYATAWGWQVQPYPLANMLILNVPSGLNAQTQYVMNTVTGAWCNFNGWHANAWEMYKDQIYFGGNTFVGIAWYGNDDSGSQINGDCQQAFNYFRNPGILKRWTMMRPLISATATPSVLANINVDFDNTAPLTSLSANAISSVVWDTAIWDIDVWGGAYQIYRYWQGVAGVGYCAAPRLLAAGKGVAIQWLSTDLVMETGGTL